MDHELVPRGVQRTSFTRFLAWLLPWAALLCFGLYAIYRCLAYGLNQTNMDNQYVFGLWIYLDLTVIALGAGAFFTGFLLYILRRDELHAVINSAVVLGLICYSGAVGILMVDVGQPLRAWFTFWHPNVHSMLTEVTFCLTCYLTVLLIEYLPIILRNRKLREIPKFLLFEHELHKIMPVFAGIGTFLSFFHQGSLGGLYGVLRAKPFAFREELGIWPSTFFLFILSAAAAGPSFVLCTSWLVEKISRKTLVPPATMSLLGKISGYLLIGYLFLKGVDTLIWMNETVPAAGMTAMSFFRDSRFGLWTIVLELGLLGVLPAFLLLNKKVRETRALLVPSAFLVCLGVMVNRYYMTIQTQAVPSLPFDQMRMYSPSWQEVGAFLAVVAYGVLLYSVTFRYTNMFPEERNLRNHTTR
jgi:menaquinone reductase, integral membrane subunit